MKISIRTVHLAVAIMVGPLVALTGASGAFLVFRSEIDAALNPSLWRVQPVSAPRSLDEVVAAVGAPPRLLVLSQRKDRAILALTGHGDSRWEVFVDPGTAKVLGQRRLGSSLIDRVKRFHVSLYVNGVGRTVVGLGAIGALILGATGLVLGWRTRRVRTGLVAVHRRLGVYGVVPSTIAAVTGLFLIFRPYLAPAIDTLTGPMPVDVVARSQGDPTLTPPPLDVICKTARSRYPDATLTRLYLPEGVDGSYAVRLRLPDDGNPHGNTAVLIDRYTGEILREVTSRGASISQRVLWYAPYPWHTGDALGLVGQCLAATCGVGLTALLVSGVILWRSAREGRTRIQDVNRS